MEVFPKTRDPEKKDPKKRLSKKKDLRKRFPKKRDLKTGKMKRVSRGLQLACFSERSVPLLGTNSANIVNNSNIQILTILILHIRILTI